MISTVIDDWLAVEGSATKINPRIVMSARKELRTAKRVDLEDHP